MVRNAVVIVIRIARITRAVGVEIILTNIVLVGTVVQLVDDAIIITVE